MRTRCSLALVSAALLVPAAAPARADDPPEPSVAREWNEQLLRAIRRDLARPTVHARNLFHTSLAMWDAWAAYDASAATWLHHERASAADVRAAREEAISHAAYRVLSARFAGSPGAAATLADLDATMDALGYDRTFTDVGGGAPAALGNRVAAAVLAFGATDGSNEGAGFANRYYEPANPPLLPALPGNPTFPEPNRWQPLSLEFYVDQSGNPVPGGASRFLGPEWGAVTPFSLTAADVTYDERDGFAYPVYHDPGPPPLLFTERAEEYRTTFEQVLEWSSLLDPADGVTIDVSPASLGNNTLGTNDGRGRAVNPRTGEPYAPQIVPAGDYYRVLAEFWADGPDSETPPGHWFAIANAVSDHPMATRRIGGSGPEVDRLEWDVKLYLALGGAMHDAAVTAWGVKGRYDYVRPISALRYMADLGQRTDPQGPSYHPDGLALVPGRVEVVTGETAAPGGRHAHLAGSGGENVGKIAARAWRGPAAVADPETDTAGVGWILVENWWPYQRPTFVTPPFAGYVSGHSTFSRAAATVLTLFTGDEFFPGGLGEFPAPRGEFLVFEDGPSVDVTLQWATYFDASDECSLSRIYGGIHPPADDVPGRLLGARIGPQAFAHASAHFDAAPAIAIRDGAMRPRRKGRGLATSRGTIAPRTGAADDPVDVAEGVVLTVGCGPGVSETRTFPPASWSSRRGGRRIGRSADGTAKLVLRPSKAVAGGLTYSVRMALGAYGTPVSGPFSLALRNGDTILTGRADACSIHGRGTKLSCE